MKSIPLRIGSLVLKRRHDFDDHIDGDSDHVDDVTWVKV